MMPAGTYYIGDLCYVMHESWDEVCDITTDDHHGCLDGEFELKDGTRFAIYGTEYGDGEYDGLSVDSGTIGCVKLSDIKQGLFRNDTKLGRIVTFASAFETHQWKGTIVFGHIEIDTDQDEQYDGYDY